MKYYADMNEDEINKIHLRVANNIKRLRQSKNISQENIALAMGFTTATFYTNAESLKRGKHFNIEHLIRIANYLEVDIQELFEDS